ncbi:hypothetical protein H4R21_005726, partial [Coemansia helicoidea]
AIAKTYSRADVVIVVPAVADDQWGSGDSRVLVSAAAKAGVAGLVLCSVINAGQMGGLAMLEPLRSMEEAFEAAKAGVRVASLVRCSLHIDMLWLFRRQIAVDHKICLSASGAARFVPLAGADAVHGLLNMLTDARFPPRTYELTGPEATDFVSVAGAAASLIDDAIVYKQISRAEMIAYLERQGESCDHAIALVADLLEAVDRGLFAKQCDDLKKLLGATPMSVGDYLEKNAGDFKP